MERDTILFISNPKSNHGSLLTAIRATDHHVVSAGSTQAVAFLFILRCVAAVLLDYGGTGETSFEVARSLRRICRRVPIILLSPKPISPLPPDVDACVNSGLSLKSL